MRKILSALIIVYVFAVIFAPPISTDSLLRYDDYILIILFCVTIIIIFRTTTHQSSKILSYLLVVSYFILISMFSTAMVNSFGYDFDGSGFYKELLRILKYALLIIVIANIKDDSAKKHVTSSIILAGILVVVFQLIQYAGGSEINIIIAEFYGGAHHFDTALSSYSRENGFFYAGGPFANPNIAGTFLIIPYSLCIWHLLGDNDMHLHRSSAVLRVVVSIITSGLIFIGIILTDSRMALAAAILVIGISYWLSARKIGGLSKFIILGFVMVFVGFLVWSLLNPENSLTSEYASGFAESGSMTIKIQNLMDGLDEIDDKEAYFGLGAGEGPQVDFEYGYYLIWYGPLGLITHLSMWFILLWYVIKHQTHHKNWQAVSIIIVAFLLMNMSQTTFLTVRIFPIFIIVYFIHINWKHSMRKEFLGQLR